jgi:hypothetical protein
MAGRAHAFPDSARNPGLPGLPSLAYRGSRQRLACVAALHWLWALLSGGGWHSGNARRSRDAPTAAGIRGLTTFLCSPPATKPVYLCIEPNEESAGREASRLDSWHPGEKPAGSAIQLPLDMPLLEQLSQKRCVAWKSVIASKAVLAQIIPASDTSSRALQHQMSRVVVLFALLKRRTVRNRSCRYGFLYTASRHETG